MKKIMFLLAIASAMATSSCKKTYECRDQTEMVTCEVNASSLSEANSMCNANNPNLQTATLK